jgi:outer membrane receptor protein involved in Fe transport
MTGFPATAALPSCRTVAEIRRWRLTGTTVAIMLLYVNGKVLYVSVNQDTCFGLRRIFLMKAMWFASACVLAFHLPAAAQVETGASPALPEAAAAETADFGEIIVTATRRATALSDVPIAVSAVSADALINAGATDLRGLTQISPSLFVSSSSSEAVGGVARIRGIGTVGDNPGLESSVATFIDGVYRSRSGVALTELGDVERIEVLRGPQGTLFGRNASAGLINIITRAPSYQDEGTAAFTYGNYDHYRAEGGVTGPIIADRLAYRLDGVWQQRDGFVRDVISGRSLNNRDRWLARGQLLFEPSSDLSVRLIADYSKRDEECCGAPFLPSRDVVRNPDGSIGFASNSTAALERALGGVLPEGISRREVALTPGRSFQSDVRDWGVSGQVDWDLGGAKLTSITAYRDWKSDRAQDADFSNLDLIWRDQYDQRFRTFTQELRLQGKAFDGRVDWLVGAYYGNEKLTLGDNLRFGEDYGLFQSCRIVAGSPLAGFLSPGNDGCLTPTGQAVALGAVGPTLRQGLFNLSATGDSGATADRYTQKNQNWALFTHNVIDITQQVSLTLGARYTHDRKTLDTNIVSDTGLCAAQRAALLPIAADPNASATQRAVAGSIVGLSCANNIAGIVDGAYSDKISDNEWSGTAVLSFKPIDRLLTYVSYSKGFKAGGFNLDRAGLVPGAPVANQLRFGAEKVDAYEIGAKYRGRGFRLSAAAFYQEFSNFQLNTFNGISFLVENIESCNDALAPGGVCAGNTKGGVVSKGVELEAGLFPTEFLGFDLGFTLADTRYRDRLVGGNGGPLASALFLLPDSRLSNAPLYTVTGGATWTPPLADNGISGLLHADFRYMSEYNTGSDLLPEKAQSGVMLVNARVGVTGADRAWSLEFWGQNLFNVDFAQVVASAPLQGGGSLATVAAGGASPGNALFIGFPAEPRTYGVTVRTKF